ncbi:MAG: hypothetical protein QOE31_2484 [Solirubrobacteraceae bacterium]|jgi:hypothetical protein|nr:hypothetical protein [Solirubrobacteraceae bacterium]
MSRFTSSLPRTLRRALAVSVVCLFAIAPAAALAAQPSESWHDHFTDTFSDQLCGIDVDVQLRVTDNFSIFADGSVKGSGATRGVITNPLTARSVVLSTAGQFRDVAPVVDEQAGTITFHPRSTGLPEKIQTAHGGVLLRDAGVISFADTFDLQTGEFISSQTIVDHGPHPEADSDFTKFCDVMTGALT